MSVAPLLGRTALITGASRGLGFEIARQFIASGASVGLCARGVDCLRSAARQLGEGLGPGQRIHTTAVDLADSVAVARLHDRVVAELGPIDILVNNAAIQGPMGPCESSAWTDWTRTVQINLMASVLLARLVLPGMKSRRRGRIVQLSGGGATSPIAGMSAYAASKAGIVRFVETLAHELQGSGVEINAIAPGALNTAMLDEVLAAGPDGVGEAYHARALRQRESGGASLAEAASLAVFLASDASKGISGRLISAVWDNWRELPNRAADLAGLDVYTLRRVTSHDRNLDWGDL